MRGEQSGECFSCRSISGEKRISPGPYIHEGNYWLVDHAYPTSLKGWLVIVLKRHVEALHELSQEEFKDLADIQYKLARMIGQIPFTFRQNIISLSPEVT